MIFVVYLGHGIFNPVAVLSFVEIIFWEREVLSSQIEER